MSSLGDRVRELLRTRHWKQADLARRCGVTRAAISNVCRGHTPSLALLRRIATELEVTESDLLEGTPGTPLRATRADDPGDDSPGDKAAASG